MKTKTVEKIIAPPPVHWVGDGFRVHNFIPGVYPLTIERMSPFLLLDYNSKHHFPPSDVPGGVGVHPHRKAAFSFPADYNTGAVVIEGKITLNGTEKAAGDHFVLFKNDGEEFIIEASANSIVLLMSGEPIREPIAAHGPFVMNTRAEIMQAYEDMNRGKFGYLKD